MQEPVGPLRRPGLRRLFTPRSASLLAAGATVAALGAAGLNATAAAAPAPPAASARVWITTADGADKLSDLGTVGFSTAPSSAPTVVVDPTLTYQTMQGFGGCHHRFVGDSPLHAARRPACSGDGVTLQPHGRRWP